MTPLFGPMSNRTTHFLSTWGAVTEQGGGSGVRRQPKARHDPKDL